MEIPIYYDNMLAKLIVWGANREEAIARMKLAIDEYTITGIQTTLPFGTFVMNHPNFISGDFNTHFIQENFDPEMLKASNSADFQEMAAAAVAFFEGSNAQSVEGDSPTNLETTTWYQQRRQLRNG